MKQVSRNPVIYFLLVAFTTARALPCENYFPEDSKFCFCNNITIGNDKPVVSVVCQRPSHNSEGDILLPDMKHLAMDHLIITDAVWDKKLEPTGTKKVAKEVCKARPSTSSYYRGQECITDYTLDFNLELPKLRKFRTREMTIRNSVLSMAFLQNPNYFGAQANVLTHFTIHNCSNMVGVLERKFTVCFDGLRLLEYLDMSHNGIREIKSSAFQNGFSSLKELNMKMNNVTSIETGSFASLLALEKLDFSDNKLSSVYSKMFPEANSSLKYISFRSNMIATIDGKIFENLLSLKIVDFKQNFIHQIPSEMWISKSLKHCDFSVNFISCECDNVNGNQLAWPRVEGVCVAPASSASLSIAEHFKRCKESANEIETIENLTDSEGIEPTSIPNGYGFDLPDIER